MKTQALESAIDNVVKRALTYAKSSKYAVHHIVAKSASDAYQARKKLKDFHIGINSPVNLVTLNERFHRHLHTKAYYNAVNALVTIQSDKSGVIAALCTIRTILLVANQKFF